MAQPLEPGSFPLRHDGPRSLMARPQRLGVLPTWWFWQDLRTERPLTSMLIGLAIGLLGTLAGHLLLDLLGVPVAIIVGPFVPFLCLGIIERGLRRLVIRRRRMLARAIVAEVTASPPQPADGSDPETVGILGHAGNAPLASTGDRRTRR